MSEVSNADIYNVLINMRGDLGRLEGKVDGHANTLAAHIVADDKINSTTTEALTKIQLASARQRGFVTAFSMFGGIIGTALGAAADYFARK